MVSYDLLSFFTYNQIYESKIQIQSERYYLIFYLMRIKSMLILIFLAILVNTQITVQAPPIPTSSVLLTLRDSPNDQRLIVARRQNLQLSPITQNGTDKTLFKLISFNRRSEGNNDTYTLKLNGTWIHLKNSPQSLSCSLVMENITNKVGLLKFDIENKSFQLLGALPITTFTNLTVNSSFLELIKQRVFLGQDCQVGSFIDLNSSTFTTYRAINNWTNIQVIVSLPLAYLQAKSNDLNYGVYNNSLYRYNPDSYLYENAFTFPFFQNITLQNSGKRLVISGRRTTVLDNTTDPLTLKVNYTIYVLNDGRNITEVGKIQVIDAVEQGYPMKITISPKMTKLGFGYQQLSNNQLKIVAKHIDYTSNTIVDLVYEDPVKFAQTVIGINSQFELDLGDAFMVVRNGSSYDQGNPAPHFEEAYQFVGSQVILLNKRNLSEIPNAKEFYDFRSTKIDFSNTDKLIVLNLYNNSATTYTLQQFVYGNLASNRQVTIAPSPPYATFTQPAHDYIYQTQGLMQWGYSKSNGSHTTINVIHIDNNTASRISTATYSNPGDYLINFQSPKCQVISSSPSVLVYKFDETNKNFVLFGDASVIIAEASPTNASVWYASQECDRVRVDSHIFYRVNSTAYQSVTNSSSFTPLDLDDNLTLAISDGGQIWKYNHSNSSFSVIYNITNAANLPSRKNIWARQNRVLVVARNDSRVQILAFVVQSDGSFSPCLNYSYQGNASVVQVSAKMSKVLVLAPINSTDFKADLFFIDYQNLINQAIDFPKPAVFHVAKTYVFLDDKFMYIRQLEQSNQTVDFKQSVYFFAQNILAKLVLSSTYAKDTTGDTWVKSIIWSAGQNSTFLITEVINKTSALYNRSITVKEINAQAAELNSNNNALCQSEIFEGKVKLCPRGCTTCDCTSCISGFVYDSSSKSCMPCAPGCIECDSTLLSKCTSCYPGYFKNSTNNCQACQSPCITCMTSATSCSKCPPGLYFDVGQLQCNNCPNNCFNCTNSSACNRCETGYVLNPSNNKCRKCSIKCSSCLAANITECSGCAKGLQLINGDCVSCPSKCLSCNGGLCAECVSGYNVNSNGVCVLDCKMPCVTCVQNQPTQCLSCQSGSLLVGSQCQIDSSCNSNHSCTNCGQGLNFYLMPTTAGTGADCLACPTLPNCVQCSSANTYKCSMCINGFYINENSDCVACNSACSSCVSSRACTGCVAGYTLLDGYSQGQCLQCFSPCASCQGSPTYCTSCISGFTKKSWMCQNNTFITLTFVINNVNSSNFLTLIDQVIAGLLQILNQTNINVITLNSVTSGSVIPSLSVSPTTASLSSASNSLTAGLLAGIPGTSFTVSGLQVTQNGLDPEPQKKSGLNIGLIVGLTVGLTLFVVAIIVAIIMIKRSKSAVPVLVAEHSNTIIQSKQIFSVEHENQGLELKETIDVDLHFAKQL